MDLMSEALYWKNGQICEEAQIQYSSEAAQFGVGVFETLYAEVGKVEFLQRHLNRLQRAVEVMSLESPKREEVVSACDALLKKFGAGSARIKVSVLAQHWVEDYFTSELIVSIAPYQRTDQLLNASLRQFEGSSLSSIKSISYDAYRVAFLSAQSAGYDEVCFYNSQNIFTEGATSNLFLYDGECWVTPSLELKVLPGIMREVILEAFNNKQMECLEKEVRLGDISSCIVSNSLRGIQSVTMLGAKKLVVNTFPQELLTEIERIREQELFEFS